MKVMLDGHCVFDILIAVHNALWHLWYMILFLNFVLLVGPFSA
jgi:hypothetical protein